MTRTYWLAGSALLLSAFAAVPSNSTAQITMPDAGWLAWQGCWRASDAPAGEYLCIVPEGAGVRMLTVAGGAVRAEARVLTDGRSRVVREDGCDGTELAHWSADGHRVFLTSDLVCEENVQRKVNGVFAITGPAEWLSVQSVTLGDQTATRTMRYLAVDPADVPASIAGLVRNDPTARRSARLAALSPVSTDDVGEAVGAVDASVVEEWLNAIGKSALLGELQPAVEQEPVVYTSALNIVNGYVTYDEPREVVHVVERPTHVHTTYVNVVRSCWDPFYSGFVFGLGGVHLGYGHTHCGGRYYSRYSPWGYDLYGWRYVSSPVVIVRSGPRFIRRPVIIRNTHPVRRDNSWRERNDGPAVIRRTGSMDTRSPVTRTNADDPSGRVTRSGYTNGRSTSSSSGSTQRVTSPPRTSTTTPSRSTEARPRSTSTSPSSSTTRVVRSRPSTSSSGTSNSSSGSSSSSQSGSEPRGKAKPRTSG